MNMLSKPRSVKKKPTAVWALLPAALLFAAMAPARVDGQGDVKSYTLFQGEDLSISQANEPHPVVDISGGSWVVSVKGQPVLISPKDGPVNMKFTPSLKLTDDSATIANLKGEGAYTFENDPSVKLTKSLTQAATLTAGDAAAASQANALDLGSLTQSGGSVPSAGTNPNSSQSAGTQASMNSSDDLLYQGSGWSNTAGYDALDVSFDVSSARRIEEPYIVVISRYHQRAADEGTLRDLIYAKALEPIDGKPMNVKFEQAGFPPGYELKGFEVHLFEHGVEIATNVAPKRQTMTADEAFDYVKTAYLKAHKGETLAPTPVMVGTLPADLKEKISKGMYTAPFYVKVTRDGLPGDAFVDAACTKPIDDSYLDSIVRTIRFKPALQAGAPVEGTSPVNLGRLRF